MNVGIKTSGGGGGGGGGYGIKSQQHGYAFGKNKNFKKAGKLLILFYAKKVEEV